MAGLRVRAAEMPRDLPVVQELCWEYRDYLLNFSTEMNHLVEAFYPYDAYAALMADLPTRHARPQGIILLADLEGVAVGCGMYHPLTPSDAEIKRVFVRETARGTGAGFHLSRALIEQARADGYKRIFLDTNKDFVAARKLYEKLGFSNRGPYSELPPGTAALMAFYEITL
ncbi:GNAT family N-acetyltransferase [Roseobacter sp. YSTF-M11]|uniref:GNAT family N-acetyltransferase n=1 Tax=Roseobacter insulae TaxID=2859783 RepID=A0A9X1FUD0_9RHOB|nr:GNAT family N-acetyltransferase [Roseobacter insulae]MBW4708065.1 GNAT family N-acetyltransferase [Roseobacter insulae]